MMIVAAAYVPNTPTIIPLAEKAPGFLPHTAIHTALQQVGQAWRQRGIDALITVSPHFQGWHQIPMAKASPVPLIYDYDGFPDAYYDIAYHPTEDAALVEQILTSPSTRSRIASTTRWGLDHGAFGPLMNLDPEAHWPIVPFGIARFLDLAEHVAFGQALEIATGSRQVALVATGSLLHRLDYWGHPPDQLDDETLNALDAVIARLLAADWDALWHMPDDWMKRLAPEGDLKPLAVLSGALSTPIRTHHWAHALEYQAASLDVVTFESD